MNWRALVLATISFAISFAAWGLVGGLAPIFTELYGLSASQTALLVAVPVLLGSLARLPMGMLTDRYGGRVMFTRAAAGVGGRGLDGVADDRATRALLAAAFFIGLAGSSFAIGAAFVSRWTPPAMQGTRARHLRPRTARPVRRGVRRRGCGRRFRLAGGVSRPSAWCCWCGRSCSRVFARNKPGAARPGRRGARCSACLRHEPVAWWLGAFYFLTFGGFVAFSIYLPTLLARAVRPGSGRRRFSRRGLRRARHADAAARRLAADRIGGAQVLSWVFGGVAVFSLLLMWPSMIPFTVGALGCAALLGLGNGAVFKLVPERFPRDTGTVTGLVGALGGLGGFFPPLLLGLFRDTFGVLWPGFVLLSLTALVLRAREPARVSPGRCGVARDAAAPGAPGCRSRARRRVGRAA